MMKFSSILRFIFRRQARHLLLAILIALALAAIASISLISLDYWDGISGIGDRISGIGDRISGWLGGATSVWMTIAGIAVLGAMLYFQPGISRARGSAGESGSYTFGFLEAQLESNTQALEQEKIQASSLRDQVIQITNSNQTTQANLNRIIGENQKEKEKSASLTSETETLKRDLQLEQERAKGFERDLSQLLQDRQQVPELQRQVNDSESRLREAGQMLRGSVFSEIPDLPTINIEQAWALKERISLLHKITSQLQDLKSGFFDPAMEESQNLIETLDEANIDTEVYKSSLEIGDLGAIVIVERILRDQVDKLEAARNGVNLDLIRELDALETEVTQKIRDVRLQIVPSGLIKFAKRLSQEAGNPQEVMTTEKTIKQIIEIIREYVGS